MNIRAHETRESPWQICQGSWEAVWGPYPKPNSFTYTMFLPRPKSLRSVIRYHQIDDVVHQYFNTRMDAKQGRSQLDNWGGGGLIFIYSGSAQLISFEINCFYGLWTRIYEYQPPQLSSWLRPWCQVIYGLNQMLKSVFENFFNWY